MVTVIPVGPNCQAKFVDDTLASVRHYVPLSRFIVLDDSGRGTGAGVGKDYDATVITTPGRGKGDGLYLTLSEGFREALLDPFDVLLRIDTDAVVAGGTFVESARRMFADNPKLGSVGSANIGNFKTDPSARRGLLRNIRNPWCLVSDPRTALATATLTARSRMHGYPIGSYVFGGVCLYSRNGIQGLHEASLLGRTTFATMGVPEDHLFGLLLTSAGFDLATLEAMMGIRWRTLPASPQDLLAAGRELVHSVRTWEAMDETAIRAVFAAARR